MVKNIPVKLHKEIALYYSYPYGTNEGRKLNINCSVTKHKLVEYRPSKSCPSCTFPYGQNVSVVRNPDVFLTDINMS